MEKQKFRGKKMKQISFFDDVFVDSFAGGGGASTGITDMAELHDVMVG